MEAAGRHPGLVPRTSSTTADANGDTLIYPKGDRTARPVGRLPKGGYYFDAIVRQEPMDEDHLDPQDWAEQFTEFADADLRALRGRGEPTVPGPPTA